MGLKSYYRVLEFDIKVFDPCIQVTWFNRSLAKHIIPKHQQVRSLSTEPVFSSKCLNRRKANTGEVSRKQTVLNKFKG